MFKKNTRHLQIPPSPPPGFRLVKCRLIAEESYMKLGAYGTNKRKKNNMENAFMNQIRRQKTWLKTKSM